MHEMPAELSQLHIILRSFYEDLQAFTIPQDNLCLLLLYLPGAHLILRAALCSKRDTQISLVSKVGARLIRCTATKP